MAKSSYPQKTCMLHSLDKIMKLSERQLELIQGAAEVLITELQLTHEEVLNLISSEMKKELLRQHTTMEDLNNRERSERTLFIRHLVHGVQQQLTSRETWGKGQIESTIRKFMEILHQSWEKESK